MHKAKFKATKEAAEQARMILNRNAPGMDGGDYLFLMEFILACQSRLPTRASYDRDRIRKAGKK